MNETKEGKAQGWRILEFSDAPIPSPFDIGFAEHDGSVLPKLNGNWLVSDAARLLDVVFRHIMRVLTEALSIPDGIAWLLADQKRPAAIAHAQRVAMAETRMDIARS